MRNSEPQTLSEGSRAIVSIGPKASARAISVHRRSKNKMRLMSSIAAYHQYRGDGKS